MCLVPVVNELEAIHKHLSITLGTSVGIHIRLVESSIGRSKL